ncbi:MAG: glycosyl hydrolase [Pontiella sp.]
MRVFDINKPLLTLFLVVVSGGHSICGQTEIFNLAKCQNSTADSTTTSAPVQYGNDGFVTQDNRWVSQSGGPHWFEVELAVPMTVGSMHLYSGSTWDAAISDFSLQYYDGFGWIDIAGTSVSGNIFPELNLMFDVPTTAQQFRLYTTDDKARIRELALYPPTSDGSAVPFGTDLNLNVAKLRQFAYSSIDGVNFPGLAIDGYADDSSAWASANAAGPHDFEVHFPQKEKVRGIHLYSGWEGQSGTQIQNFEVAYSNDASGWVLFDGGAVANNTELNLVLWFGAAVNVQTIRIRSLDSGQTVIRELVVLRENNTGGYPLWTDVKDEAPPTEKFTDYDDGYYTIKNREKETILSTSTSGSTLVSSSSAWFQLLLNIGTDTYRLRSKDSGECFEVLLASTHDGAAVVEGVYSSMPHQRWRLLDSGDGTHFRIVNVWSGKALDITGSTVIQNSVSTEASQEWSFAYQTHVQKKGQVAFFHYNYMYQPSWFYSWSATAEDDCEYGDYHPMQWGWLTSSTPVILRGQPGWYSRAQMVCAMGFNEPDKNEQANIPEENAAYQWPRFERMNLPLVGPCPAQNNGTWRKAYEAIAEEEGLRSEYMALHWYAGCNGGSPQNLINVINNVYNTYGKPIWITEFAVKDWYATGTWSRNDNFNWLAEFLWRAESIDHLKKYSLFEWVVEDNNDDPTVGDGPTMGLHIRNDKGNPGYEDLSECGLLLAGWDGIDAVLDETEYIIHNKGRGLRLIDHPASNTVSYANIMHRTGTDQFMFQTTPNGNKYIVGVNDGRLLHYDGSSVGFSPPGTTGSDVEWELNENQYGWFFIDHPSTSKRLRITSSDVIDVDNDTNTGGNLQFRFIRPAVPVGIGTAQSVPYAESFEDGWGGWVQSVTDDYDWQLNHGGTPTLSAGPSGASDGDAYLYAEGHSSGGSYKTSRFNVHSIWVG